MCEDLGLIPSVEDGAAPVLAEGLGFNSKRGRWGSTCPCRRYSAIMEIKVYSINCNTGHSV
jgi:hypothetical protein